MNERNEQAERLATRLDNADVIVLRFVKQDSVGNSEFDDTTLDGDEQNMIVAALRHAFT